jgi:hypothetical protein
MRLKQEGWGITALFSNFDLDRFDEAGMLAPIRDLLLFSRGISIRRILGAMGQE